MILLLLVACQRAAFRPKWAAEQSPEQFTARFETSKGNFDIRVTRAWSPAAADRFYQLVRHRYLDSGVFYRVVPDFVAQFGRADSALARRWKQYKVPDEPVVQSNRRGTLSFARDTAQTRGAELFINLKDNPRLDTVVANGIRGYPPFGEVVAGMEVVDSLYRGYAGRTMQQYGLMQRDRTAFLQAFPLLDRIYRAYLVKP